MGFFDFFRRKKREAYISKETALEILNMPAPFGMSAAARVDLVMGLLEPSSIDYDPRWVGDPNVKITLDSIRSSNESDKYACSAEQDHAVNSSCEIVDIKD